MSEGLARWFFDPSGLTAHGFCLLWKPGLIWTHAVSDAVIGIAYIAISLALGCVARRRHDLAFKPVVWLFASFILLCATGHLFDLLTLWVPAYGVEGLTKAATAFVSAATAICLWLMLPKLYSFPSQTQLSEQIVRSQESEARYRLLADSTSDAITSLNLELIRTYVSPAYRTLFGYDPDEVIGTAMTTIVHPDDVDEIHKQARLLTSGENDRAQLTFHTQHKLGHWVWTEGSLSLLRDTNTDKPAFMICSARDITDRHRQAEELRDSNTKLESLARHLVKARDAAERSSRAKSRFLAGMSHELRTPLNGLLGYAHLLHMEGCLSPTQHERVDAMLVAGQHLLDMITCVLDLSEIEAEHVEMQAVLINVQAVALTCINLVRPVADAKRIALSMVVAPDTQQEIIADPTRLRQVLLNLLGNAVKFTRQGAVELRLLTVPNRPTLRIEVADTGPGVPVEFRQRLFQEFERLGAEMANVEGAGLGLALSARLAALMGGRIGYEDNPNGGSVFWLELPVGALSAVGAPVSDTPNSSPDSGPTSRLHVLVVDDVLMNRDIASSFLRAAGHQVTCLEGGAQAVAAAKSTDFDVVLMDVRMPEMDGLEATRRIRALEGPRGQVPVVALTAQAFADQVAECRKAGMNGHLAKPFLPDVLIATVVRASTRSPAPSEVLSPNATPSLLPSIVISPPPLPVLGAELPVLDTSAFERTAVFLAPNAIASYLKTIVVSSEELLRELQDSDALVSNAAKLADGAHALAGSAGMFGFERVAGVGRSFELAVQSGGIELSTFADGLAAALKATIQEIHNRTTVTTES